MGVSDNDLGVAADTETITVNQPPTCSISSSPSSGTVPLTVTFSLSASDSDGSIAGWVLDVNGDGNADYSGIGAPPSTKTHTYTSAGTYNIIFIVKDDKNVSSLPVLDTVTVNQPPACSLSADVTSGKIPLTVTFTMSASDSDGSITGWVLDVNGDSNADYSGIGAPPSSQTHIYNTAGEYSVVLIVSDNNGATTYANTTINANTPNIAAKIDSYTPASQVIVEVGNSTTLSVTFTNTGDTEWKFIAGASVWDSAGNLVADYEKTLDTALQPDSQTTVSWTHAVDAAGDYKVQFGVWKVKPYISENLLDKEPSPSQVLIVGAPASTIVITAPLKITPEKDQYYVGDALTAQFTVKNIGTAPVTLDVLTVGGRDPNDIVIDFWWQRNITLYPNSPYTYTGKILTLPHKEGNYHFFCTYKTQEGHWNPNINLGDGLTDKDRIKDITVLAKYYLSSVPLIDRGGIIIPKEIFPAANGKMMPVYVPSVIDGSNIIREDDNWITVRDDIIKTDSNFSWEGFLTGFMTGLGRVDTPQQALFETIMTLISSSINAGSSAEYKITIQQKGSEENFRAIVQQAEHPSAVGDLAGIEDICVLNPLENLTSPKYRSSKDIAEAFHLDPSPDNFSYFVYMSIDSLHENDEYLYYLSVASDNRIILTPKIYPNDNIKIMLASNFNPFNHETVAELTGDGFISLSGASLDDKTSKSILRILAPIYLVSKSAVTVQEHSSGELRVYDSQGNVTGIVNGEIKEEIPNSIYDNESKTVTAFDASVFYYYKIVGTDEGAYGLTIDSIEKETSDEFVASNIPTLHNAVHQYVIDWNALSQAEKGTNLKVDSEGDGVFERTITTGNELTRDEFLSGSIPENSNPFVISVYPSSGGSCSNKKILFTTTYLDLDSWQNIKEVYLLINTEVNGANCFYGYYNQNEDKFYLRNDGDTDWLSPDSNNIIQNSYAKLDCAKTAISGSDDTLIITWAITFKDAFLGKTYNTYLKAKDDAGAVTDWQEKGTYLIDTGLMDTGWESSRAEGEDYNDWIEPFNAYNSDNLYAHHSNTSPDGVGVELSWDGGVSYTSAGKTAPFSESEETYILGASNDTWGRIWSSSELNNANFRLRISDGVAYQDYYNFDFNLPDGAVIRGIEVPLEGYCDAANDYVDQLKVKVYTDYIYIPLSSPIAYFTASPKTGKSPLTVQFNNESVGEITDYLWDFGDGSSSSGESPSHTYNDVGTYTVKLTANWPGGSDEIIKTDYITVEADIIVSPGESIQDAVNNSSDGDIICVREGSYVENINAEGKTNLRIKGEDISGTVIRGSISCVDSDLSVEHMSILYGDSEELTYSDLCIMKDAGVTAVNSNVTVKDCLIMPDPDIFGIAKSGKGIQIWNLYGNPEIAPIIENNLILNADMGMYLFSQVFSGVISGRIKNNTLVANNCGILLRMHKENPVIQNNIITNSADSGVYMTYEDGALLNKRISDILGNDFFNNTHNVWCDAAQEELTPLPDQTTEQQGNLYEDPELGADYIPQNPACGDKGCVLQ
ncbi:MAG: PKD domain-containing protein [Candidatus Omnitrophica bacterium]|nr:PKD domain-containing protein [Candidatus Omnitrophota bacterium]